MCAENPDVDILLKKNFFLHLFLRDRERQGMSRGGAETEGDTESKAGFRFWAVSTEPDVGLEPTNCKIMTWAQIGRLTKWATQAPLDVDTLKDETAGPLGQTSRKVIRPFLWICGREVNKAFY